jgi:hypothetical protein
MTRTFSEAGLTIWKPENRIGMHVPNRWTHFILKRDKALSISLIKKKLESLNYKGARLPNKVYPRDIKALKYLAPVPKRWHFFLTMYTCRHTLFILINITNSWYIYKQHKIKRKQPVVLLQPAITVTTKHKPSPSPKKRSTHRMIWNNQHGHIGIKSTFLKTLAFLSFCSSQAVRRSKDVNPFRRLPCALEICAPPLMKYVKIGPKIRVKVHKAKPIFYALPNSNGVSKLEN